MKLRMKKEKKIVNKYVLVYFPKHENSDKSGYIQEHRLIVEIFIGRLLTNSEVVHHLNGFKTDNKISNLMLFKTQKGHKSFENKIKQFGYTNPIKRQIENRWKNYK